jgi:large exoprotein involved in heme utilization and adhesion
LDPQAGDIAIDATDSVVISDNGAVLSQASSKDIGQVSLHAHTLTMDNGFIQTSTIQSGRAGDVSVTVDDQMTLVNGGKIISSSLLSASGKGGTINVTAGGAIVIAGRSNTSPPSELFVNDASSGLFSTTASPDPLGSAGKVVVTAPTLTIADHGKISVESTGVAPAGDISLTLGTLTLSGGAGLFSNATSSGPGGNINVQAEQVQLASGATISASSSGTGLAGSVTIQATTFQTQDSFVTTEATQADGGDIDILVGSLVYLTGSEITTSVGKGAGKGGNITIDPQFVVLNNSQILANAFGGPGGNITIVADVFLSSGSILSASSALSAPGTISIDARITDLSDSLVQLPDNVLQAANLLRTACTARVAEGKASSLVVAGREGVPPEPEGLLWSPLGATLTDLSATPREAQERERLPRFAGVWLVSNCAR